MTRLLGGLLAGLLMVGCVSPSAELNASTDPTPEGTLDPDSPYRTTLEEFMLRTKACLEDRGLSVEVNSEDNSLLFNFGSQREQELAMTAVPECQAEIDPARLEPVPPRSAEQLGAWYAYVKAQVDCLADAGYPVPSPPPEAVFIDSQGDWDPYYELVQAGAPPSRDDRRKCEQVPGRPPFLDW